MKVYFKILIYLALSGFLFGFIGPYLVSLDSDETVLIGFGLIFVLWIPLTISVGRRWYQDLMAYIQVKRDLHKLKKGELL